MTTEPNIYPTLPSEIFFINIGRGDDDFFNWKNLNTDKVFTRLDVLALRAYPTDPEFFLRMKDTRRETKTVIKKFLPKGALLDITFIVVAQIACQFQIIEAYIEYIADEWFQHYSFSGMDTASNEELFAGFRSIVTEALTEVPRQCLKKCQVYCKPIDQLVDVFVKKTLVTQAEHLPVALVFEYAQYYMLLFLDAQFKVREQKIVDFNG